MIETEEKKTLALLTRIAQQVEALTKAINPNQEKYLCAKDAARYLGISQRTIMTYKEKRLLPYSKLNGKLFFKQSDLDNAMEQNKVA